MLTLDVLVAGPSREEPRDRDRTEQRRAGGNPEPGVDPSTKASFAAAAIPDPGGAIWSAAPNDSLAASIAWAGRPAPEKRSTIFDA